MSRPMAVDDGNDRIKRPLEMKEHRLRLHAETDV